LLICSLSVAICLLKAAIWFVFCCSVKSYPLWELP
jgi:hypothetical protein